MIQKWTSANTFREECRVVKALDLSSNGRMSAWVRTPLLTIKGPWWWVMYPIRCIKHLSGPWTSPAHVYTVPDGPGTTCSREVSTVGRCITQKWSFWISVMIFQLPCQSFLSLQQFSISSYGGHDYRQPDRQGPFRRKMRISGASFGQNRTYSYCAWKFSNSYNLWTLSVLKFA